MRKHCKFILNFSFLNSQVPQATFTISLNLSPYSHLKAGDCFNVFVFFQAVITLRQLESGLERLGKYARIKPVSKNGMMVMTMLQNSTSV